MNICVHRSDAVVCEWGAFTKEEPRIAHFKISKHLNKLHCTFLCLRGVETCRNITKIKLDYRHKVMCGQTVESDQSILLVNTL